MIVNPYLHKELLVPHQGTNLLQEDFGLIGTRIPDPFNPQRYWGVQALYTPADGRAIGGIRTKLVDDKQFITFINQMDLEVLLGVGKPGAKCKWSGQTYLSPEDRGFYGMCCDDEDLLDDLHSRELSLRGESLDWSLSTNAEILRRVHAEERIDVEELFVLLWDGDPETGVSPDVRLETLERRWARVERLRLPWEDVPCYGY